MCIYSIEIKRLNKYYGRLHIFARVRRQPRRIGPQTHSIQPDEPGFEPGWILNWSEGRGSTTESNVDADGQPGGRPRDDVEDQPGDGPGNGRIQPGCGWQCREAPQDDEGGARVRDSAARGGPNAEGERQVRGARVVRQVCQDAKTDFENGEGAQRPQTESG